MGANITYINDENVAILSRSPQVLAILRENIWLRMSMRRENPVEYRSYYNPDGIHVMLYNNRKPDGHPDRTHIAQFALTEMPGCQGILVSHGLYVSSGWEGKGIAQTLLKVKEYIAKEYEYSRMIATTNAENVAENHILAKFGWKADKGFKNAHTGHIVLTWTKNL